MDADGCRQVSQPIQAANKMLDKTILEFQQVEATYRLLRKCLPDRLNGFHHAFGVLEWINVQESAAALAFDRIDGIGRHVGYVACVLPHASPSQGRSRIKTRRPSSSTGIL